MQYPNLILSLCLLGLFPQLSARSEENASAIAIETEVYPNGLYPGRQPGTLTFDPDSPAAHAPGGYEVLSSLSNVTGLRTDAVQGAASEGGYIFQNLRIASRQTSYDDYLIGYFSFDLATQRLSPTRFERAPAVGIYEPTERFLLKDSPGPINFYTNPATPNQFAQGGTHTFQSNTDYYTNLTAGQRLCFLLTNIPYNQLYRNVMLMEDGAIFFDMRTNSASSSGSITPTIAVLVSGKYRFRLEAVSPATPFSFRVQFYNENNGTTTTVKSGDTLSASLGGSAGGYGLPYKKFKIRLNSGQTVSLPGVQNTYQYLINDRGKIVGKKGTSGINETVTATGDYYIVIAPYDGLNSSSESYSGRLTVANGLSFLDWANSYRLAYGQDGPSQDADRDGMTNLLEYALGLNPARPDATTSPQVAVSATQLKLLYNRPDYLQNVTVQPTFSTTLRTWTNVTPAATGSTDGLTRMEAVFPRTGNQQAFGKLRVTSSQ